MRAYITGTSTRKVDDLVNALGCDSGVSRSTVSRICMLIDDDVAVLRGRRLDHLPFVYVWLHATYVHVREHGQVISKAMVIATGCRADGHREVLGVDIGNSENETFWTEFLRGLVDRGLAGVKLVISDAGRDPCRRGLRHLHRPPGAAMSGASPCVPAPPRVRIASSQDRALPGLRTGRHDHHRAAGDRPCSDSGLRRRPRSHTTARCAPVQSGAYPSGRR